MHNIHYLNFGYFLPIISPIAKNNVGIILDISNSLINITYANISVYNISNIIKKLKK